MATVNEKMTALDNEIRTLSGTTSAMGLDAMATNVNEANVEIDDQTELLAQAIAVLEGKAGGSGGVSLPELTNEGSASDLLSGKQLIDGEGNIVEGTIATKTASNLTASGATVTVPAGYYASQATKSVSTATQATPSVSVNASGLITASTTQSAGYVSAGTKSGTKQLTTQASKTITPTKSSQTAVAKNVYTTGAVTVAAIPSQYITTTDATASAADMRKNATAYVNGSKITGAIEDFDGSYECSGDSTGGSGGGSVETCTVTLDDNDCGALSSAYLTVYRDGVFSLTEATSLTEGAQTINDVICNSVIAVIAVSGIPSSAIKTANMSLVNLVNGVIILQSPSSNGEGIMRLEP